MFALDDKVFQNGVECDSAISVSGVDSQNQMKNLKPGASLELKIAYVLNDKSKVDVEVTELLNLASNPAKVTKSFSVS